MKRIGFVVSIVEFVEELLECDVFFVVVYFDSVKGVDVEEFIVVVKQEDGVEFYMIVDV